MWSDEPPWDDEPYYDDDEGAYEAIYMDALEEQYQDDRDRAEYLAAEVLGLTWSEWFNLDWARGDL